MILLPFVELSNHFQLYAISKRFEIEERGWLHSIANLKQFYAFFNFLIRMNITGDIDRNARLMRYI